MVASARRQRVRDKLISIQLILTHPDLGSVDAEWIATKKDWQESEKKHKAHEKDKSRSSSNSTQIDGEEAPAEYDPDMDEMRCILYSHGGT